MKLSTKKRREKILHLYSLACDGTKSNVSIINELYEVVDYGCLQCGRSFVKGGKCPTRISSAVPCMGYQHLTDLQKSGFYKVKSH